MLLNEANMDDAPLDAGGYEHILNYALDFPILLEIELDCQTWRRLRRLLRHMCWGLHRSFRAVLLETSRLRDASTCIYRFEQIFFRGMFGNPFNPLLAMYFGLLILCLRVSPLRSVAFMIYRLIKGRALGTSYVSVADTEKARI